MFKDLHSLHDQAAEINSDQGQTRTAYSRRTILQAHKGIQVDDGSMGTNPQTLQVAGS